MTPLWSADQVTEPQNENKTEQFFISPATYRMQEFGNTFTVSGVMVPGSIGFSDLAQFYDNVQTGKTQISVGFLYRSWLN